MRAELAKRVAPTGAAGGVVGALVAILDHGSADVAVLISVILAGMSGAILAGIAAAGVPGFLTTSRPFGWRSAVELIGLWAVLATAAAGVVWLVHAAYGLVDDNLGSISEWRNYAASGIGLGVALWVVFTSRSAARA